MCKSCLERTVARLDALEYEDWLSEEEVKIREPLPEDFNNDNEKQ